MFPQEQTDLGLHCFSKRLNVLILTFGHEFSGIIYRFFRGKQTIFLTVFCTKFVIKCAAKVLKIGKQTKI